MRKLNPNILLKNELQRLIIIHKVVNNNQIKTSRQLRELCKIDLSSYSFLYQNNILVKEKGVYVWKKNVLPNTALASTIINWRNERKEKRKKKEKQKTIPKVKKTISFLWGFLKFNY